MEQNADHIELAKEASKNLPHMVYVSPDAKSLLDKIDDIIIFKYRCRHGLSESYVIDEKELLAIKNSKWYKNERESWNNLK